MLASKNAHLRSSVTAGDRFSKYQGQTNQQTISSSQNGTNCQPRDSYSKTRNKETSVPK